MQQRIYEAYIQVDQPAAALYNGAVLTNGFLDRTWAKGLQVKTFSSNLYPTLKLISPPLPV